MTGRDFHGNALVPGVNVDRVDVGAGLACLIDLGWDPNDDPRTFMLVEYCLMRWARGEEAQAQHQVIAQGDTTQEEREAAIDLTSWYAVLAAAQAAAVIE